ncbi:MAG: hypothetical protein EPN91_09380 [Salinibacterium sp.]|nr:MAG: hypothetical protein EPN91_09380 [Salinibacterium sp.]
MPPVLKAKPASIERFSRKVGESPLDRRVGDRVVVHTVSGGKFLGTLTEVSKYEIVLVEDGGSRPMIIMKHVVESVI